MEELPKATEAEVTARIFSQAFNCSYERASKLIRSWGCAENAARALVTNMETAEPKGRVATAPSVVPAEDAAEDAAIAPIHRRHYRNIMWTK